MKTPEGMRPLSIDAILDSAQDDRILSDAERSLEEVTSQCAGSCYWGNSCLCNTLFDAVRAIRNHRSEMVPL